MKNSDYIKQFELPTKIYLDKTKPVVVRLDIKNCSKLSRKYFPTAPFSHSFRDAMIACAQHLLDTVQGCELAYTQSDEISLFLKGYTTETSELAFGGVTNKINSILAASTSVHFNRYFDDTNEPFLFQSRCFNVPDENVLKLYFQYRQEDGVRNCINTLGRLHFSQKQLNGKNRDQIIEMLDKISVHHPSFVEYFGIGTHLVDLNKPNQLLIDLIKEKNNYFRRFK